MGAWMRNLSGYGPDVKLRFRSIYQSIRFITLSNEITKHFVCAWARVCGIRVWMRPSITIIIPTSLSIHANGGCRHGRQRAGWAVKAEENGLAWRWVYLLPRPLAQPLNICPASRSQLFLSSQAPGAPDWRLRLSVRC